MALDREGLATELERHGLQGRWVDLEPQDVPCLELPTLAALANGTYLLILPTRHGRIHVQGSASEETMEIRALPKAAYLDLAAGLAEGSLVRTLIRTLLAQKRRVLEILAAMVAVQAVALLVPQFTRILVDRVFPSGAKSTFQLVLWASAFTGVYQAWILWLHGRYERFLGARLGLVLEQGLLCRLLRLPCAWIRGRSQGQLLQGIAGLQAAQTLLTGHFLEAVGEGFTTLACLGMMVSILPGATGLFAGLALLCLGLTLLAGFRVVNLEAQVVEAQVRERGFLIEILRGITSLKASGAERHVGENWARMASRRWSLNLGTRRAAASAGASVAFIQILGVQGLTLWGGLQVLQGNLRLGELLAFLMLAASLQQAISGLGDTLLQWCTLKPQLAEVRTILETPAEPVPPVLTASARQPAGIDVQDLAFRYRPERPWVFKGLDLVVPPGEKVLLSGLSGCGKSTLLKILAGLCLPERGLVVLGGLPPRRARGLVAYLPQSVQLFNGSLRENLRLLSGGAGREELEAAALETGLARLVATLPMAWETLVSPGGDNFSGGQRQLIALTAAIATPRPVLLLDEPLANLDPMAKAALLQGALFKAKTVIMASHDLTHRHARKEGNVFRVVDL
ncbi:peptidase C39 [Mesoterricola sediminis]|uniref:Peptidase C39 n=2 Tax=Mesoterricola sediminis TaxID=2927980 RepID=A0AA48HFU3_9BACT|nr:peptidase C39 [Mesoterricola sediminis]